MQSVISIQSAVAYGHVGNSAAVFPMQRLGIDVWPVHTVLLSNHPGHGHCRGHKQTPSQISEILLGMEERGALARANGIMTGYLGDPDLGGLVMQTVAKIKANGADRVYACDPVMGDHGGFFVADGLPQFFKNEALAVADILTPNVFELGYLSDMPTGSLGETMRAAKSLLDKGPRLILVTSVECAEYPGQIGMLLVTEGAGWAVFTPKLAIGLNGTGDCLSALTLAHDLKQRSPPEILHWVASTMFGLVKAAFDASSPELLLIQAQHEIVVPSQRFDVFKLDP